MICYIFLIGGFLLWLWGITDAVYIDRESFRIFIERKIQGK